MFYPAVGSLPASEINVSWDYRVGFKAVPLGIAEFIPDDSTAKFIAHARADIPRLLAHVAALEAAIPRVSLISRAACIVGESGSEEIASALDDAAAAIRALTPQPTQESQP